MNATTIRTTTRTTIGRSFLAALAMALVALALSIHTTWAADAQTINTNANRIAWGCADIGGTIEWVNGYDEDGNLTSQWAFCTKGASTMGCEYSGKDPICATFLTGSTPDIAAPSRGRVASTEGSADAGGSTHHAGTYAAPTGSQVVLADDDDRP